jgi:hypothetical protein
MYISDILHIFAALDGTVDESAFISSIVTLLGTENTETLLNFPSFVALREFYVVNVGTILGGFRLSGRQYIRAAIHEISPGQPCAKESLISRLPSSILNGKVFTSEGTFSDIIRMSPCTLLSYSEIKDIILGKFYFHGLSVSSLPTNYQEKLDIMQLVVDKSGTKTFALCRDGTACVFENVTGLVSLTQRILYAEPLLSRSIEGHDKYLKWLLDCGLPTLNESGSSSKKTRFEEMIFTSKALSDFCFSMGLCDLMVVDPESGLVVVNCSLISSSICVYEPSSLRRLYRIRAPGTLSADIESTIREISTSRLPKVRSQQAALGCVQSMKVWSSKSLLICSIVGAKNIFVLNFLTGDAITELSGHSGVISSLCNQIKIYA